MLAAKGQLRAQVFDDGVFAQRDQLAFSVLVCVHHQRRSKLLRYLQHKRIVRYVLAHSDHSRFALESTFDAREDLLDSFTTEHHIETQVSVISQQPTINEARDLTKRKQEAKRQKVVSGHRQMRSLAIGAQKRDH